MKDRKYIIGFPFAWRGLSQVIKEERNIKIHLILALGVVIFGIVLSITRIEWLIILLTFNSVIVAEMFNSVIERIIDYLKPEWHPHAMIIKDMAAGAVLVSSIFAVIIGLLIFIPKIL